jgi:hypothetical protein
MNCALQTLYWTQLRPKADIAGMSTETVMEHRNGNSGGSALYISNRVQRAWRDVHGGAAHMPFVPA